MPSDCEVTAHERRDSLGSRLATIDAKRQGNMGVCAAEASRLQWMEKSPILPPFFRL